MSLIKKKKQHRELLFSPSPAATVLYWTSSNLSGVCEIPDEEDDAEDDRSTQSSHSLKIRTPVTEHCLSISAQRSTQSSPTEKLRSGLEDNTPQLDIELPHKQTPDSLDWPSNLLLSGTEHPHPRPGCSPSCLRCAPMTALPDIKA